MMQPSVILAQLSWIRNALDLMPTISLAQGQALMAEVRELEIELAGAKRAESKAKEARISALAQADLAAETARVVAANKAEWGPLNHDPGDPGSGGVALSPVTCTPLDAAAHE